MAAEYVPQFPYTGSQVIVASDRITLLSKQDSILLFGDQSISLSTKKIVHINAIEGVRINPGSTGTIQLGLNARESVIKGDTYFKFMEEFLTKVENLSRALSELSETNLASSVVLIRKEAESLQNIAGIVKTNLKNSLSNVTKTL